MTTRKAIINIGGYVTFTIERRGRNEVGLNVERATDDLSAYFTLSIDEVRNLRDGCALMLRRERPPLRPAKAVARKPKGGRHGR